MNDVLLILTERIERLSPIVRVLAAVASLATVAALDLRTGPDLSVVFLYALCAVGAAWTISSRAGTVVAVVAALAGFGVDAVLEFDETWSVLVVNHVLRTGSFLLLASLTAAARSSMDELMVSSRVDAMTGALNQHGFLTELARVRRGAERHRGPLAVVYFDLDGLKVVNDRDGHAAGDALIRRFADRVQRHLRTSDPFGRLGGDEFALVLERADQQSIDAVLARILDDPGLPPTSCGVQVFEGSYPSPAAMLAGADRQMYADKQSRHPTRR
jgi:diguanylate cyclase (GGDEF)-like protein